MKLKKRLAALAAMLMMAGTTVIGSATPAHAAGSGYILAGTPVYDTYWTGSTVVWVASYNAWLSFDCYADSGLAPYYRFMRITGTTDFIRTAHIDPEPGGLPRC